jgi:hypothetical protein
VFFDSRPRRQHRAHFLGAYPQLYSCLAPHRIQTKVFILHLFQVWSIYHIEHKKGYLESIFCHILDIKQLQVFPVPGVSFCTISTNTFSNDLPFINEFISERQVIQKHIVLTHRTYKSHHSSSSPIQSLLCPDRKQDIVKTISKP